MLAASHAGRRVCRISCQWPGRFAATAAAPGTGSGRPRHSSGTAQAFAHHHQSAGPGRPRRAPGTTTAGPQQNSADGQHAAFAGWREPRHPRIPTQPGPGRFTGPAPAASVTGLIHLIRAAAARRTHQPVERSPAGKHASSRSGSAHTTADSESRSGPRSSAETSRTPAAVSEGRHAATAGGRGGHPSTTASHDHKTGLAPQFAESARQLPAKAAGESNRPRSIFAGSACHAGAPGGTGRDVRIEESTALW